MNHLLDLFTKHQLFWVLTGLIYGIAFAILLVYAMITTFGGWFTLTTVVIGVLINLVQFLSFRTKRGSHD